MDLIFGKSSGAAYAGQIGDDRKVCNLCGRVSKYETNVKQIGNEGQVCNLCEQVSKDGTGGILD
jgi:hypothetical protein